MSTRTAAGVVWVILVPLLGCDAIQDRRTMDKGNKLFAAQNYEQAIPEYQKIVARDAGHWGANYQLAMSYLAQFHPQSTHPKDAKIKREAKAALEKLMTLQAPSQEEAEKVRSYYLGLLTSSGDDEAAVAFLQKRTQEEPNNKDLIAQLAQLQAKAGDFDAALSSYEKIANMEPGEKTHWYTIGVLCWERSNKAGITVTPEQRTAIIQRGLDAVEKALRIDSEYFEALAYKNLLYREKADALYRAGMAAEAQLAVAEADRVRNQAVELQKKKRSQAAAAPAAP